CAVSMRGRAALRVSVWELFEVCLCLYVLFFFNDTATTEIYTLSLHDALPILCVCVCALKVCVWCVSVCVCVVRSEEHTSELQSHLNLVCRLLLDKKHTHC